MLRFGTGAGITWGSDAEGEWRETELKAARLVALATGGAPGSARVCGMTDIRVWVDGTLVGADAPAVSAVDHGVTVGDGAFETAKIDHGVPFAVTRHLRRLDRTIVGLGLPPADHDRIREGIDAVLDGEPIDFGRLRFTVTGGRGPLGSDRHDSDLTHIVTAVPHADRSRTAPWSRCPGCATSVRRPPG